MLDRAQRDAPVTDRSTTWPSSSKIARDRRPHRGIVVDQQQPQRARLRTRFLRPPWRAAGTSSHAGRRSVTVVPRPTMLLMSTDPPDCCISPNTCARPSPVPRPCGLVVKNGSTARAARFARHALALVDHADDD